MSYSQYVPPEVGQAGDAWLERLRTTTPQQFAAETQASPAGVYTPSAGFQAGLMGLNRLAPQNMQAAAPPAAQAPAAAAPTNQLMPPIWQEEWQRVYDQMAQLGHNDPQTVAYETIAKYGLGPYAQPAGPAYGGGVSGGGG
jgi:hypothetical protein